MGHRLDNLSGIMVLQVQEVQQVQVVQHRFLIQQQPCTDQQTVYENVASRLAQAQIQFFPLPNLFHLEPSKHMQREVKQGEEGGKRVSIEPENDAC